MPRVSPDLLAEVVGARGRLIVLSNRGPLTFDVEPDAPRGLTAARGSGGLVTALAELGRHAPVTWVAAARSAADALVAPILPRVAPRMSAGSPAAARSTTAAGAPTAAGSAATSRSVTTGGSTAASGSATTGGSTAASGSATTGGSLPASAPAFATHHAPTGGMDARGTQPSIESAETSQPPAAIGPRFSDLRESLRTTPIAMGPGTDRRPRSDGNGYGIRTAGTPGNGYGTRMAGTPGDRYGTRMAGTPGDGHDRSGDRWASEGSPAGPPGTTDPSGTNAEGRAANGNGHERNAHRRSDQTNEPDDGTTRGNGHGDHAEDRSRPPTVPDAWPTTHLVGTGPSSPYRAHGVRAALIGDAPAITTDPVIELEPTGPDEAELEPTDEIHSAAAARLAGLDVEIPAASRTLRLGDVPGPAAGPDPGLVAQVAALVESQLPGQDIQLRFEVLPESVRHGHYEVVANPLLWFLQHQMFALPYGPNIDGDMVAAWRTGYRPANRQLADAAVDAAEGTERPTFLIQDYHLYLAAERIRERRPDATILHFTHIPWPSVSVWQTLPQGMRRAICEGLLAADIVGLQTDRYATNFLECVASFVRDARIDGDGRTVRWRGRRIRVGTYPISLDPDALARFARSEAVDARVARLQARLERAGNPRLIVRADRIEPSKNALRGFLAFEDLLRRRPELRGSVRFIAVQAPTRTALAEYAEYATAVREVVARINGMAEPDDQPVWIYDGSDYAMAIAVLRLADAVLVNPVVDGMNLVAKEAVLVSERDPVLVLSETAGAAEQLARDTLPVAPADVVGTSEALERALFMSRGERHERARRLRQSVRDEDIGWWLNRQLRDLAAIRRDERPPSRRLRDTVRLVEASAE